MKPETAQAEFENIIEQSGVSRDRLTSSDGIRLMLDFYRQSRFENCPIEENGDMLLYQWGTYNWGLGPFFQCDIGRQFIESEFEGDDGMSQLSLCFYFYPSEELEELKSGDRWCESPNELGNFESYIKESRAYTKVANMKPARVEILYSKI
jgi:hypothetical protein